MVATLWPDFISATAICIAIVDLPDPPFSLPTTIMCADRDGIAFSNLVELSDSRTLILLILFAVILKFNASPIISAQHLFFGVPSELSRPVMRKNYYLRWHTSRIISKHRIKFLKLPRGGLSFCDLGSRHQIWLAVVSLIGRFGSPIRPIQQNGPCCASPTDA